MRLVSCSLILLCAGCALNSQRTDPAGVPPKKITADASAGDRRNGAGETAEREAAERVSNGYDAVGRTAADRSANSDFSTHSSDIERARLSRDAPEVFDWALADADRLLCVNEINRYRTTVGRNALVRSPALETFAADAARVDQLARAAHHYFRRAALHEPRAENEIPWWPLESFQSVAHIVRQGIAMFWNEGPAGGHYRNMLGPWREVGCGGFMSGGAVTITVEFR